MGRYVIYLKSESDTAVKRYAEYHNLESNQAIRVLLTKAISQLENRGEKNDISLIKSRLENILILFENLLPEISFLSATTRSSLLGKSDDPLMDGDLAAQKSRRFLASLLKEIKPTIRGHES